MNIDISRPWVRSGSATELQAAGFMTLANKGAEADRLVAAISPLAEKIEIHGIKVVGAGIAMLPLERGVGLPADTTITLQPRGYHLLLQGLKAPLAEGQRVPVTLTFEKAGTRQVELTVQAEGPIGEDTLLDTYREPG
jgi:copper(I)-binding protein